jgi:hypothetical protein
MEKKIVLFIIFFIAFQTNAQVTSDTHKGVYSTEQVRQNRMQQNDDAHRSSMNSSTSSSSGNNNSGTGVSAAQHWEDVKNSNKKVVYTEAELAAIKKEKELAKKKEEDRLYNIEQNKRNENDRLESYLKTADNPSLPSSERLAALDNYMVYYEASYSKYGSKPDQSNALVKKAYIYFADGEYEKAYENFRIPYYADAKTKQDIIYLKTYCGFLTYEDKYPKYAISAVERTYNDQKEWILPFAYTHYLDGNEEKTINVLENHLKTIADSETDKYKYAIYLAALYSVYKKNELAFSSYNTYAKTPLSNHNDLTKTITDYLAFICDENLSKDKIIRISTLFGIELQKRLMPNNKSIVEKSLKVNQKLNRTKEIEEDKNLLGDKNFKTKQQRLEVKKQQEIEAKIAHEQWEKDKPKREAEVIEKRKNSQHPKYFNLVTEEQKGKGYKQYDNIVELCNNLYKTKIIDLADQNNYTDEILGEQKDNVKGLKIYYKNNCLTAYISRYNKTDFNEGYLDAKSCSRAFEFDNIKDRDNEYDQIIKDIKKSKQYKNIKDNYFTKGHLEEVKFKSIENAIYSNTFINIEMYKQEQTINGKYPLHIIIEIDE